MRLKRTVPNAALVAMFWTALFGLGAMFLSIGAKPELGWFPILAMFLLPLAGCAFGLCYRAIAIAIVRHRCRPATRRRRSSAPSCRYAPASRSWRWSS